MTAKEYLSRAFMLESRINSKLAQIKTLRATATKASAVLTGMPSKPSRNVTAMEDAIVKMVDLETEISVLVGRLVDERREITEVIARINDPMLETILELRYLCYKDWNEIASELNYHRRHLFRLHGQALAKVVTPCHLM